MTVLQVFTNAVLSFFLRKNELYLLG